MAFRAGPALENARRYARGAGARRPGCPDRAPQPPLLPRAARPGGRPRAALRTGLALIVFDLDDFKAVNDKVGHLAGDAVLAEASERMRTVVRSADIACRVGGDEFAIILPSRAPPMRSCSPAGSRAQSAADRSSTRAPSSSRRARPSCGRRTGRTTSSSGRTRRSTGRRSSARPAPCSRTTLRPRRGSARPRGSGAPTQHLGAPAADCSPERVVEVAVHDDLPLMAHVPIAACSHTSNSTPPKR